jgi:hypothetical protein
VNTKILCLAVALCLSPAFAADPAPPAPVTLQPDQGYVLVRTFQAKRGLYTESFAPVLIRLLDQAEIDRINAAGGKFTKEQANVVNPSLDHPYAVNGKELFLLEPLKPGTYVLGGLNGANWNITQVFSSLCMGTVKFEVKPGVITDLGTVLNALHNEPTDIPELTKWVAGKDVGINRMLEDVAIRPRAPDTETPDALKSLPIVAADFHAVGWLPNFLGGYFGRLAPLPGVLDYDKDGNVLDLKAPGKKTE